MADLSAIKLPNGTIYNLKDRVSGYTTNTGTITKIQTTAGAHTTINISSGAAAFNVPTKTSHLTNDSGFLTAHQTLYEANLNWGNTNLTGNVTPMGASLSAEHSANRIAYLNPAAIQIEYTTNGGSSWADSGYSDTEKTWLCTGSQGIAVGQSKSGYSQSTALTTNHWTRITLTGQNGTTGYVYTAPKKMLINMGTALGVDCLVEYKTGVSGASWQTFGTYAVSGWSGWNDIPLVLGTFGGGTGQTSNNWYLRFTFKITSTRTDAYKGYSQILGLRLFGSTDWTSASSSYSKGPFSSTGHLYSYDVSANATFPAKVTANGGFSGALTGNVTGTATGNLTSVQYDSTNAKLTYTKNGSNTDIVTVATLKSALGSMPASDVYNWAKASTKPTYTASEVGAAASSHTHGNITNGGDITATAPTIASGDQIIINDNSASKVTNGPTFDGSTTTTALTPKGTWENFSKFSGSYNDLTNKPTIPSAASLLDIFYPVGTIYETTVAPEIFNPNTAWGGEWEPIHGRFLVAEGNNEATGDEALNLSAGGTGGKNAYKLSAAESGMRAHTHTTGTHYHTLSSHTHAGPSHHHSGPSHSHGVPESTSGTSENFLSIDSGVSNASFTISTSGNHRYTVGFSGSGHFHSHAATKSAGTGNTGDAGTGATGAPSKDYTSTAYNTTSGTGTPNTGGVNTISNGIATSAHENLPPYLAVYMWKRIA